MSAAKPRLGRGLSALLGDLDPTVQRVGPNTPAAARAQDQTAASVTASGALTAPIGQLRRNPDQPRKRFDEGDLEDLAASIRSKGVLQPIVVRPIKGESDAFQIVAGERRWRAAQKAGLHEVPILVRELSDQEVLEIAIIENVQRADLNPMEEAKAYQALIDQFGHKQEDIAKAVGKSRPHVANTLRLLALPERVRDLVAEQQLSAGHARAIAAAPDPEALAQKIVDLGLTVREAEALARKAHEDAGTRHSAPARANGPTKDADTLRLENDVAEALGLEIDIRHRGDAGGELRIRYGKLDQLEDVCRRLRRRG